MYAGLTTADKGALESYLSKGIDRCPLMLNGELQIVDAHEALAQIAEMERTSGIEERIRTGSDMDRQIFIPIYLMDKDRKQKELLSEKASEKGCVTWNERINQMSAEEKADLFLGEMVQVHNEILRKAWESTDNMETLSESMTKWLNSPYTEGETK